MGKHSPEIPAREEKVTITVNLNAPIYALICYQALSDVRQDFVVTLGRHVASDRNLASVVVIRHETIFNDEVKVCRLPYRVRALSHCRRPVPDSGSRLFASLAKSLRECSTIHSPPAPFFFFLKWRLARAH